jgi:TPR repeat protein
MGSSSFGHTRKPTWDTIYRKGLGVAADRTTALTWLLKAAEQNDEWAKQMLRDMGIQP